MPGTLITMHFSGWEHICPFLSRSSSDDRSFCRSTASWIFLMRRNSRQSSAKSLALEDVASGKSFMSAPSAVHSYRVPGKFIRRLKSLFVG